MLLKRIGRAGVIIVLAAFCFNVMAQKSTFDKPDFAFPEEVSAVAGKRLPKAMAAKEWKNALLALVQLTVASNSISTDSVTAAVERIDSEARKMPAPWKSVGLLMEARLLADAYRANAWTYNQRNLPEDEVPQSIAEWSKDTFGRRILALVEEAFGAGDKLAEMPLAELDPLVTSCGDNATVLDFVVYQGIDLLSPFAGSGPVIPFGRVGKLSLAADVAAQCDLMIDSLISRYEGKGEMEQLARALIQKSQLMPHPERYRYLLSQYEGMGRSAAASALLVEARNYLTGGDREEMVKFYKLAKKAVLTPGIENMLAQFEAKSVDLDYASQVLPSEKIKVRVNWNNLPRLWLHLYRLPGSFDERSVKASIVANWKPVASVEVSAQDSVLLQLQSMAELPGQAPGRYAVIVSTSPERFRNEGNDKVQVRPFMVSNLSAVESEDPILGKGRLYVIDGRNGAPVAGASVVMVPGRKGDKTLRKVTDSNGGVELPEGGYEMTIASGGDTLRYNNWRSSGRHNPERTNHVRILTDLALYHPGDTVRFMALAWSQLKESARAEENAGLEVVLLDANYNPADTVSLKTDRHGRAWGEFRLPTEGLLGSYSLQAKIYKRVCGETSVTVADYKAPGFFVEVTDAGENVEIGDTLTIRGRAITYAGVPVAGGNVNFNIRARMPWWLFSEVSDATYGATTTTDAEGAFTLKLPTEGLRGTPYARCAYELEVAVTSQTGETQQAPKRFFSLGDARQIQANISPVMERREMTTLLIGVSDMLDHPVEAEVSYQLLHEGKEASSGTFRSPRLSIDMSKLPSGRYEWKLSTEGAKDVTLPMVLYGRGEKVPPCDTALWVPQKKIVCEESQQEVKFLVGSSYPDSWVLMQVADDSGVTQERWLKIDAVNETVSVSAPKPGSSVVVRFAACRNLKQEFETVQILSAAKAAKLEPEIVSFRDRTVPGDTEKWSFRFLLGGKAAPYAGAAATMSDKALDAVVPFGWTLSVASDWAIPSSLTRSIYLGRQSAWFSFGTVRNVKAAPVCLPEWNFYGQSLFGPIRVRGVMYDMAMSRNAGGMMLKEEMVMTAEAASDDAIEEAAVEADEAEAGSAAEPTVAEEVKMRPAEMPLAFFKPDLEADAEGIVKLDFEVPDFNTTWKLQLAAWTDEMKTSVSTYEIMARKPVIAHLNAPRFVRTGDEIVWRATLSNASDSVALIGGAMEISDAVSGKTLATVEFPALELAEGESRVVEMPWKVPFSLQLAVVKVIARSGRNTDGEQTIVGVLPSASPVIDSKPFYLGRNQLSFTMQIPDRLEEGTSTLEVCGNPLWYCITALPDIQASGSSSVLSLTNNIFANSLAAHLAGKYPQIGEAIKAWRSEKGADSPLISNLEKNQELKSVALENTPWVNDAASETLRMERLETLLDAGRSGKIIGQTLADIRRRQGADGGWSWCEGMEPSEYITTSVVAALGLMKAQGCFPQEAEEMVRKAIRFIDREIEKDYSAHPEWISETTLLGYLYVRGFFDVPATGVFASLQGRAIKLLTEKWRNLDVMDKSLAAIVLNRSGKQKQALEVLESLRQFAVKSEVLGVWFDNPGRSPRLLTTAMALQAFAQLAPGDTLVDGMRQWLVLQRRTQDWGASADAAFVVATLLQSGTDWTSAPSPSVNIGEKELPLSEFEQYTSSGFFTLSDEDAGKELRISRSEGVPAWGGVMVQSVQPISDVKPADVADLRIEKAIYAVDETANGTELSKRALKVGDKVRVMLTLTATRRIDYVAVTDERAACLEPVEQLSGFEWRDRTGYYREVRDASTQLFISSLEKGVHELWYDCFVGQEGEFSCGIATAQSLQAPLITAHSGGSDLKISSR